MADAFQIRLLGPMQVQRAGQPVRGFESRKVLVLLGYLALRGQPTSRSHLADLLWPERPEARGRANLSVALHNLTTLLPDCLVADRHSIALSSSFAIWVDVAAFEDLAGRATPEARATAVDLYRGEFMADVFLDDCPDAEIWLVTQRERWRGRVAELLFDLAEYHTGQGALVEALRMAERLIDLEPWREEAHRQVMLLHARRGERSAALAHYETCQRVLADELGVEPAAETAALCARIRAGEIEPDEALSALNDPAPPTNLPIPLTAFFGRGDELATIATRLADPACRLLTLVGPGGIGKTRLAIEAAGAVRHTFPDGVWFVRLGPVAAADLIVPAVADALALIPTGPGTLGDQIIEHLRNRRLLLVLDTFEHLLAGGELLLGLLEAAPLVKLLVTSRQRLDFQAEWLAPVGGLGYPEDGAAAAGALPDYPAARLFVERAGRVDPGFALTEATQACVARICRLLEGMPLALELAASQAGDVACERIADEVERNLDFLVTSRSDVTARHRSLRAVFEQSWRLLPEAERAAFARLAVFRGGFTAEAAERVAGATAAELHGLKTKSLLGVSPDGRYDVHELLRQFAFERLVDGAVEGAIWRAPPAESGQRGADDVHRRHAVFCLALAEAAAPELRGPEQAAWLERLAVEHENLSAALAWAVRTGVVELGLRMIPALGRYWELRGRFEEGRRSVATLLALPAAQAPTAARARALTWAGALAEEQGDYGEAQALHDEALRIWRALDDQAGIAEALNNLGNAADYQGNYAAARALYGESLAIRRELGDPWAIAGSLNNLGNVAQFQGDYAAARALYSESLAIWRSHADPWAVAVALNNLGLVAAELGDFAAAQPQLEESLTLGRAIGDQQGVADALQNLGDLAVRQGEPDRARALHAESLSIRRTLNNRQGIAASLESLASLARVEGRPARAARLLGAAAALRQAIHSPRPANEQAEIGADLDALRASLGVAGFEAAWSAGWVMRMADAVDLALAAPDKADAPVAPDGIETPAGGGVSEGFPKT